MHPLLDVEDGRGKVEHTVGLIESCVICLSGKANAMTLNKMTERKLL